MCRFLFFAKGKKKSFLLWPGACSLCFYHSWGNRHLWSFATSRDSKLSCWREGTQRYSRRVGLCTLCLVSQQHPALAKAPRGWDGLSFYLIKQQNGLLLSFFPSWLVLNVGHSQESVLIPLNCFHSPSDLIWPHQFRNPVYKCASLALFQSLVPSFPPRCPHRDEYTPTLGLVSFLIRVYHPFSSPSW